MEGEEEEETSEGRSGCQSGWTMYLGLSYEKPTSLPSKKGGSEQEEEDLSMVSDASSGPPHFHEEDEHYCYSHNFCDETACFFSASALAKRDGKRRRVEAEQKQQVQEPSSFLDDTASSPLFSFSKNSFNLTTTTKNPSVEDVLELSCSFSENHFKGNSKLQKHLGYLQSSTSLKATSARPGRK